jgi:Tfp pilus assembly protein PilW
MEALMAVGVTALIMTTVAAVTLVSARSFAALVNYSELDADNRVAIDHLTRDLRECNRVTGCTTNTLTLEDSDGFTLTYTYSAGAKTLTRTKSGVSTALLTGCDQLAFWLGQRNPVGGSYDVFPAATPATAKVVNVSWLCSRSILGMIANTESVQTARIVIRKQGT